MWAGVERGAIVRPVRATDKSEGEAEHRRVLTMNDESLMKVLLVLGDKICSMG